LKSLSEEIMSRKHTHLSDQDLIMAADGELPSRRKPEVTAHLEACWSCRERMNSLESTIGEFVRARNQELNRKVPSHPGPQALLRARLAEASLAGAEPARETSSSWRRAIWQLAPAAIVFLCVLAASVVVFEAKVRAEGPEPRAGLTPGETRSISLDEVCSKSQAEVVTRNIPEETRRQVFSEYGIREHADNFEIDYLITPDLGGAPSIRNLWPQPYSPRWNAHVKDKLEQRLHQLVCEGRVDLPTAQHDIATDWIGAYKKYFHTGKP
jgi:hypothetical protein